MKRERLKDFTERAIESADLDALVPPIVYLPGRLRQQNQRLTLDNIRITCEPPTIRENHLRIANADPLAFLIAMMHGQPVPCFEVTSDGAVKVRYEVADLRTRERIARWLGHKVTIATGKAPDTQAEDWDELVSKQTNPDPEAIQLRKPGPGRPVGS